MARAGFYNENEYRDYPFVDQTRPLSLVTTDPVVSSSSLSSVASSATGPWPDLPEEAIVDCGLIMGLDAEFNDDYHWVYLYRIARADPYFIYELRTNAPGAEDLSLVFTRNHQTDTEMTREWAEAYATDELSSSVAVSSSSSLSNSSEPYPFCRTQPDPEAGDCAPGDCATPVWEGFLVTGRFAALLDLLADGEEVIYDHRLWVVEPARVQNLSKAYARSINLANTDRTHTTVAADCSGSSEALSGEVFVQALCLQGDLVFREGYNCSIRQDDTNNSLVVSGVIDSGSGRPCGDVPGYPGEAPPPDSPYLSGGPACSEVIQSVNGKSARDLVIETGPGFRIAAHPTRAHTLVVTAVLDEFTRCLEPSLSSASC